MLASPHLKDQILYILKKVYVHKECVCFACMRAHTFNMGVCYGIAGLNFNV